MTLTQKLENNVPLQVHQPFWRTSWLLGLLSVSMLIWLCLFGLGWASQGFQPREVPASSSHVPARGQIVPSTSSITAIEVGQRPLSFEPNLGQTDPSVQFLARGRGYTVFLTPHEAVLALSTDQPDAPGSAPSRSGPQHTVRLQPLGANLTPTIQGQAPLPQHIHRLKGRDATQWQTDVPVYGQVHYQDIYPGIDLLYYGRQHRLEYDFLVSPGTDPSVITMGIQGAEQATLDEEGHLWLSLKGERLLQLQKPIISQTVAGKSTPIDGGFILRDPDPTDTTAPPIQVSFAIGEYDATRPLIIDPLINYASTVGGEGHDRGEAIAVDHAGHGYLVGTTNSFTFPVTDQAFQASAIGTDRDVFVTKFDTATGDILFSTYIGGEGHDWATGVAVDEQGLAYLTGYTRSLTFPTRNPFQATRNGTRDAFVLKLAQDGASLHYSTYLGGAKKERARSIVVDHLGQASVTGDTTSGDFPTEQAIDAVLGAGGKVPKSDAFVTTLNAQGDALVFSTYLGGAAKDRGYSLAIDQAGHLYLTGMTKKVGAKQARTTPTAMFPITPGAFQPTFGGGSMDAFVAKINPTVGGPDALGYASYVGGTGKDVGLGIFVAEDQQVYLTGWTKNKKRGPGFPVTADAVDPTANGGKDAFLAQVNPAVNGPEGLVYATYLGGKKHDEGTAVGMDGFGRVCVAGTTASRDFPLENPFTGQDAWHGGTDGFLTKWTEEKTALLFSSYVGGQADDELTGMALDQENFAYLTGQTRSTDFPLVPESNGPLGQDGPQALLLKVQDPVDIVFELVTNTVETQLEVGTQESWEVLWLNGGPDVATQVRLRLDFADTIVFDEIVFEGGTSTVIDDSCIGTALDGPGGSLVCSLTDIPVTEPIGGEVSTAEIFFTPVTEGSFLISGDMSSQETETDPSDNSFRQDGVIGPSTVRLNVDFQGQGTGMTAADPPQDDGGFICFNDCELVYPLSQPPTSVTLTATPTRSNGGQVSIFSGWDGCLSTSGNQCMVEIGSDQQVTATFAEATLVPNVVGQSQGAAGNTLSGANLSVGTVTPEASSSEPAGTVIRQNPAAGASVAVGSDVNLFVSSGPAPVTVPNVVGQSQGAAGNTLSGANLNVGNVTPQASNSVTAGNVISQTPTAGNSVAPGSTVNLVVSSGPAPVTVPNVVGQSQGAAGNTLSGANLSVGTVTSEASSSVTAGNVISQTPTAGNSVAPGSTVNLVVSSGPAPVTVPNVVGQSQGAAGNTLSGANLNVGNVTPQASNSVTAGNVISQTPTAGNSVAPGSTVNLVVSSGPAPVTVPNVVGQSQGAAGNTLSGANLSVGTVTSEASSSVTAGNVISQTPTAGNSVAPGSTVNLVVSSGPAPVTVPNVVGQSQGAAGNTLSGANLSVGTVTSEASSSVTAGNVISQTPTAGNSVAPGSTVNLVVSSGPAPVTVPNVVGQSQGAAGNTLSGANLNVGNVTLQASNSEPAGNVISQTPTAGNSVAPGSTVNLVVSSGPAPVTVPNVVGQSQGAAGNTLSGANLNVGNVTLQASNSVTAGNVISQTPTAGNSVAPGSTVNLVVSNGPPVVPAISVPDVVGQTQAAASSAITGAGLTVGGVSTAASTSPEGSVLEQAPESGAAVSPGTAVNLVVSSGPNTTDVDVFTDGADVNPGDQICETATGGCTLRAAIQEANAIGGAQTIILSPGTYQLTVDGANEDAAATGDLDITGPLTIASSTGNAADVIIDGGALNDRVFDLPQTSPITVTLRELTIQGGQITGSTGGGIRNVSGNLTIEGSLIRNNRSNGSGGGISHLGGALALQDTMVQNNTSEGRGGGVQAQEGTVTITATTLENNTANFGGGLSTGNANVTVIDSQVTTNRAAGGGGGIYKFLHPGDLFAGITAPAVRLEGTTLQGNTTNDCEGYLINGPGNSIGNPTRCHLQNP